MDNQEMVKLVEALRLHAFDDCGGKDLPTHIANIAASAIETLLKQQEELLAERDTPEVVDFAKAVQLEAWHQRDRWGSEHDAGKSPFDWFWLIGYLSQKAASAAVNGDSEKAKHHTISTAAALANWHLALSGGDQSMRPGIEEPSDAHAA